jgi:hypothetical protein
MPIRTIPIASFSPVSARVETTQIGTATTKAQNILFRPKLGVKGPPILRKPWGFGASQSPFQTYSSLTNPFGVGNINSSCGTICVRIYHQGINIIQFFNMATGDGYEPGERGTFYAGDDGTYSGVVDFNEAGPPLFEVLAINLDHSAQWYCENQHGQLLLQNGVDDAVIVQIGRTLTPGKYRKRGSNAVPATPAISLIEPQKTTNTQATRVVTGRAGSVDLVFTANKNNFIGVAGNNKIKVKIEYAGGYSSGPITSTISGDGTVGSPYLYTITTTNSNSSNNAIIAFVNADTKALPILSASGANATADSYDDDDHGLPGGAFLTNGSGTGDSDGLSNEVIDVFARYWDGGYRNCGYEGPSSQISNELVIDGMTYKDLLITVDIDESAEGGRFSHANAGIRLYKRYGTETAPVWNLVNADAPLPNTQRATTVFPVGGSTSLITRSGAWSPISYDALTNEMTVSGTVAVGDIMMSATAQIGLPAYTRLFVISAASSMGNTTFKLSLTSGGSEIDIGTSFAATLTDVGDTLQITGVVTNGQTFKISSTTNGLPGGTLLYVISASTVAGVTTFQASLTNGGAAIDITSNGSTTIHVNGSGIALQAMTPTTNRLYSVASKAATSSTGAGTISFIGTATNGQWVMLPTAAAGLPARTKLYVINAYTVAGTTTCKLSLTSGGSAIPITASTSLTVLIPVSHLLTTSDIIELQSGGGASASSGMALDTRYYVSSLDNDGFGIQLSTSRLGTALEVGSNGTVATAKVKAVCFVVGSNTEPGQGMSPSQNRPPPHRYVTMAGDINWCAGIPSNETKVYSSKDATVDEVSPEGVDLEDVDLITKSRGAANPRVSGLWSDKLTLHLHYMDGVVIVNPADTTKQQEPMLDAGMANGRCVSTSEGNRIIFLGGNRQIMEFNGARYGNRSSKNVSDQAIVYVNDFISQDEVVKRPDQCCTLHDKDAGMFFYWMPDEDGKSIGFAYDEILDGVVGPFTAPCQVSSAMKLEAARGKYLVANKDGYIFVWDCFAQADSGTNLSQEAITLHETTEELPADHNGYDYQDFEIDGETKRVWYATHSILESGFFDAGSSGVVKKFCGLRWRTVKGSRGFFKITLISPSGQEQSVMYGEVGGKQRAKPHQVLTKISDTAVKVRMEVFAAEQKSWIVRDCEILIQ